MKKNILFLNCDALWFGSEKILYYVIKILSERYNCFVVLPYYGFFIDILKKLNVKYSVIKYPVLRKKYLSFFGVMIYLFQFIVSLFKLINYIKKNKIDVIYSNSITVLEGVILSKLMRKKHIWHIHSVIEKPSIIFQILRYFLLIFKGTNIYVSYSLFQLYKIKESKENIVIQNGIEPVLKLKRHVKRKEKIFTIGTIGTFNEQKGQIYLLKSIKFLLDHYPMKKPFKVILVGSIYDNNDYWLKEINSYIKENRLDNIVEVRGFTQNIKDVYKILDVLIITSVFFDSFPTVALEAISSKVLVLSFRSGGIEEILNYDKEVLVASRDYESLSRIIYQYYSDKEKRLKKISDQFQFYKKRFTYEIFREKLLKAITEYLD